MLQLFECPVCGTDDTVLADGYENSPVLIIGEFPGKDEVKKGRPFTGATGELLRKELLYLGIDMRQLRYTNLWIHPDNKRSDCLVYSAKQTIKEAKGKKAILLLGSDTVKYFCDKGVREVCGLEVTSPFLSAPSITACVNPADCFHGSCGEFRLALKKFTQRISGLL